MGKIGLKIKANLTNVSRLYPQRPEQFSWALKVKCTGCGEVNPNWHLVSQDDVIDLVKDTANFMYKCKCCSRENCLKIIPSNFVTKKDKLSHDKKNLETMYLDIDEDKFKTIIAFDCRGLELIEFEPRDGWMVESNNKIFEDVDLSEKEWCDYNDIDNVPVEVNNIQYEFENIK